MVQALEKQTDIKQWIDICSLDEIYPNTGVCAFVKGEQVAIFRVGETEEVYAISNYDPFSKAYVLSRGLVGDRKGIIKVASPIYKQNFNLATGECLDDETVTITTYSVRINEGRVELENRF
jgi:nitrite reductase (NADH) small subunit